jgi:hypothetical protein
VSRTLAQILIDEAPIWGVTLARRGDMLSIRPAGKAPLEFKELLRENKPEILSLLEAEADGLAPDQAPWLHIAKEVLLGEFCNADTSTRESLMIGLRSIGHATCKQALERLAEAKQRQL